MQTRFKFIFLYYVLFLEHAWFYKLQISLKVYKKKLVTLHVYFFSSHDSRFEFFFFFLKNTRLGYRQYYFIATSLTERRKSHKNPSSRSALRMYGFWNVSSNVCAFIRPRVKIRATFPDMILILHLVDFATTGTRVRRWNMFTSLCFLNTMTVLSMIYSYFLSFLSLSFSLYNMQPEDRSTILYNYYIFSNEIIISYFYAHNIFTFISLYMCIIFNFLHLTQRTSLFKMLLRYKNKKKKLLDSHHSSSLFPPT